MANIKVKLDGLDEHLKKTLTKAIESISLKEIGQYLADDIKLQTRLGYGVDAQGEDKKRLAPLSEGYIKQRRKMKLSNMTTAKRSNLTQTGEMLDSIKGVVRDDKITLTFSNQFSKDKARWNTDKGRAFMNLSKTQILKLQKKIQGYLLNFLNKNT